MAWLETGQNVIWKRIHPNLSVDRLAGTVVRMTTRKVTIDVLFNGAVQRVSVHPEHLEVPQ